ncbi:SURF1 family protein [Jeongeupia chitinilytica]|uniref:SURF1-like protein n=1 Tax=Jeongeupia chitinilytica TaxID=1041641 RepID=A0ABQ3H5F6_9NEIS|nr:SURF1 family protein [Jeongeupia chitinilytica]GHD68102.1 SURF1-like protein [Jeongeupia chitinilytica]
MATTFMNSPAHATQSTDVSTRRHSAALLVLGALVLLTLALGIWQCRRGLAKQQLASAVAEARQQPIGTWPAAAVPSPGTRTLLAGHWLPALTFTVTPRPRNGQAGAEVVTPFRLADGRTLLVNRGWQAEGRALPVRLPAAPVVEVADWPRFITLGPTPPEGNRFQHVDAEAYAHWAGSDRPVGYAYAVASDGLVVDIPQPYLNAERHFAYMASWWGMTLAGAALWWRFRKGIR